MLSNTENDKYKPFSWFSVFNDMYRSPPLLLYVKHDNQELNEDDCVWFKNLHWKNNFFYDDLISNVLKCYEREQLIVKKALEINSDNKNYFERSNYITLSHEIERNTKYHFEASLLEMIRNEAMSYNSYYHRQTENKYFFTVNDILVLIMFLKFPSFRLLLNEHLIEQDIHFTHYYRTLCNIDYFAGFAGLKEQIRTGYTILNSPILSTAPIIFSEDMSNLFYFPYQGLIFPVRVQGKFIPLSLFGVELEDMFIVIVPNSIEITLIEGTETTAKQFCNRLNLVEDDNLSETKRRVYQIKHLINAELLYPLFSLYHDEKENKDEVRMMTDFIMNQILIQKNTDILSKCLLNMKRMKVNMTEFFCTIWLELISNINDKMKSMSILALRQNCRVRHPKQIAGKIVLEYQKTNILSDIGTNIENITFQKYIDDYIVKNFPNKEKTDLSESRKSILMEEKMEMTESEAIEKFLYIMKKYSKIINKGVEEQVCKQQLGDLFDFIKREMSMAQLLDILFDLQNNDDTKDLERFQEDHECKLKNDCSILDINMKTRSYGLRSRIQYERKRYDNDVKKRFDDLTVRQYSKM
eukprot:127366_1